MSRYIDEKEILLGKFIKLDKGEHGIYQMGWNDALDAAANYTPTADVRENVRGEWIDKEVIEDREDSKIQEWQQARCSVCNKWHTTPYMYYFDNFDFCPNCGADMKGEKGAGLRGEENGEHN